MNYQIMGKIGIFLELMEPLKSHHILLLVRSMSRLFGRSVRRFKIKVKDIENILQTYVDPFKVKDGREKTEKEAARSKAQKDQLNQEIQDILQSDQVQNIINSSISKEEAQSKINAFLK